MKDSKNKKVKNIDGEFIKRKIQEKNKALNLRKKRREKIEIRKDL